MWEDDEELSPDIEKRIGMTKTFIPKSVSRHILMAGNYYKHHHPGGISAVVQYWSRYIEDLQYYPTYKLGNVATRACWFISSYLRMALRMLTDRNIKIVHLHTAADGSFWRKVQLIRLAKRMRRKVILHVHASRFKDFYEESNRKPWILENLQRVDLLIVLSASWKEWFTNIGMSEDKIVILHNITEYPQKKGDKVPLEKGRPVRFLFLGEIGERKGVFDILGGISQHKEELNGKIKLRIGGNKHETELQKQITDNGLENIVNFEGWVSGDKKIELLNWADVFILPSHNEGLPISILEAMSYGMPVISTPVGGIPEVVNKQNGILVQPGNEEAIAQSIIHFVEHPSKIAIMGNHSQEVVKTYLPDYVMSQLKEIYEKLLLKK
ncbi:glycosyltransferase, group 1 family protein [Paraprevotella clara YIT 11840]|uniref:Glycosyltransferase, group 1 family protein n=2 Tax=Paraprevotella clara TaxID=454154 RepID=G5STR1_9BACT|nr:glycosyltransferase, group 1 family protein [Paraprevotella clara YIT 11840]